MQLPSIEKTRRSSRQMWPHVANAWLVDYVSSHGTKPTTTADLKRRSGAESSLEPCDPTPERRLLLHCALSETVTLLPANDLSLADGLYFPCSAATRAVRVLIDFPAASTLGARIHAVFPRLTGRLAGGLSRLPQLLGALLLFLAHPAPLCFGIGSQQLMRMDYISSPRSDLRRDRQDAMSTTPFEIAYAQTTAPDGNWLLELALSPLNLLPIR